MRLYPSLPYAHKYANAVNRKGMIGTLNDFIFANNSTTQAISSLALGTISLINQDLIGVMKLLIDAELKIFHDLKINLQTGGSHGYYNHFASGKQFRR